MDAPRPIERLIENLFRVGTLISVAESPAALSLAEIVLLSLFHVLVRIQEFLSLNVDWFQGVWNTPPIPCTVFSKYRI